ncbi:hypothetical protein [Burkholderia stabilis]|uniref:hypothetical protein n=1 Tax=Burkholderia stabilis TaxID=95485 RepID=UPI001F4BB51B|nr:hypothetical protein [Burkholderia stabilis]
MSIDAEYRNDSRYRRGIDEPQGRIFLSGQQALVRMMLAQAGADRAAGLNTAGFVTGYRGSPLGGLDHELWRAKALLEPSNIRFQPAINEDLAATALIGTQRVETDAARRYDGVFGMWYGKGPGVDRSGDALKHGNAYGSSPHGGVLVVTGDDHGCVSSSMSHQSDRTLVAWGMPVVHPAGLADYERCGLWGWALSRASGLWVGFKAITDTVEASTSLQTSAPPGFTIPPVDPGPDGLHWRWPDLPGMQIERRHRYKLEAARAFIRTNPLDEAVTTPARPVLVIGAVGKAYRDVREVLQQGGISLDRLEQSGVALLKINLVYPLSPLLETWAKRAAKVLVIEEKQAVVEDQLKQRLYNIRHDRRATIIGKADENGRMLLSEQEELRPSRIAQLLLQQLAALDLALRIPSSWIDAPAVRAADWVKRTPYLCSGCPHNTSTRVPDGSEARLGIGCHAMAARMPERATSGSVQMGGEGVDWLGQAPFVETPHIFQNIGDGTFFHSGYLAIRQAVAARATITYKLLYNDAVAMTGGQPVDGSLDVRKAIDLVRSEGVQRVVVVADDPDRYKARAPSTGRRTVPSRSARQRSAATARDARRQRPDLRPGLRDGSPAQEEAAAGAGDRDAGRDQRDRLRGMRRLSGQVQLPVGRAGRYAVRRETQHRRAFVQHRSVLREGFLPEFRDDHRQTTHAQARGFRPRRRACARGYARVARCAAPARCAIRDIAHRRGWNGRGHGGRDDRAGRASGRSCRQRPRLHGFCAEGRSRTEPRQDRA